MIPFVNLDAIIDRALDEDLQAGDLTTEATVAPETRAVGRVVAHAPLVMCGADVFARVHFRIDPAVRVECLVDEGVMVAAETPLLLVEGSARSILMAERTALNFLQRLCGVATHTRRLVERIPAGAVSVITDTRKTTPGLRCLERYAVRTGGGKNHRDNLGSAVLIKDNHIAASGGIAEAIARARRRAPHTSRIEIEVESLVGVDQALAAGADIVMLDNFAPEEISSAIARCRGRALVEVSGGVTLERIEELALLGVDVISVGALTHSSPAADIGLDIEPVG